MCNVKEMTTYVELPREAREAGLAVDAWEDVEGELFWPLDDDVLAGGVPADHVVVLGAFEETWVLMSGERGEEDASNTYA